MTKILYVPLDDRDCNYEFPYLLSLMTEDIELLRPPYEWMGFLKRPADIDKIWNWLYVNAGSADYAILSVDTLVYGNIIGSRIHRFGIDKCTDRLSGFRKLKKINPSLHIHAFNLAARVAAYDDSHEDPDYWENYGKKIWKYTYLADKSGQGKTNEAENKELQLLKSEIPAEILDDFLSRRKTDRFVNLSSVEMVKDSTFDTLTVPKDDTAEYGYAAMDQGAISDKVKEYSLYNRVYVYPGADEAGSVLFSRVFCQINKYRPTLYVRYSSINGPHVIPRYEDRPLGESIKWQITSAGGIITETPTDSDCMLAVNASGTEQLESSEQDSRDIAFKNNTNSEELLRYVEYYNDVYQKAIGICDVTTSNGCDNEFMENARCHGIFDIISAAGGWNTAENTNGVVIAHTIIASYYNCFKGNESKALMSDTFLVRAITADWLCQANVLPEFYLYSQEKGINPYFLKDHMTEARTFFESHLSRLISDKLGGMCKGRNITLDKVRFNWDGAFYFAIDLSLVQRSSI
ncbi:MAG: DUF4127 family protein [Lachnospiraceae bacterium]|nr:DUF4127 family protein [Lachnospiraceae bacterium]MDD4525431.1 DUF4127 family protein [Lachnospiraceae bacterium]